MTVALVALGSRRQVDDLFACLRRAGADYPMYYVADSGRDDRARRAEDIFDELRSLLPVPPQRLVGVSLGRATVAGSIAAGASGWSAYASEAGVTGAWLGPSPAAAATFEDKLLTMQALSSAGVRTVPWSVDLGKVCLRYPLAVKASALTGGVGIYLARTEVDVAAATAAIGRLGQRPLYTSFRQGVEVSVEALLLPGRVFPLASVFKEASEGSMRHADWKIKLAVPVPTFPPAAALLDQVVDRFPDVCGYLSIEGIVADSGRTIEVIELATRRTGNFALSAAVAGPHRSIHPIHEALSSERPMAVAARTWPSAVGVSLATTEERPWFLDTLKAHQHLVELRLERLSELPGAEATAPMRLRSALVSESHGSEELEFVAGLVGDDSIRRRYRRFAAALNDLGIASGPSIRHPIPQPRRTPPAEARRHRGREVTTP